MLERLVQNDWSAGAEVDVAPHLIDPRGALRIRNGLLADDGAIFKRGGSVAKSNRAFGTAIRELWDGWLEPGRRTVFASPADFGVLDSNDATPINLGGIGVTLPAPARLIEDLLFLPGGTIYGGSRKTATYAAGTVTTTLNSKTVTGAGTAFVANVDVGMLFRISGERVYVVSSVDSDTQLTLRDAYEGSTGAGKAYTLKALETASTPYKSASQYGLSSGRLLVVEGSKLHFSEVNRPHDFTVTIGGVSVENFHELDEGVQILGVEQVGSLTLVFSTAGIIAIRGLEANVTDNLGNTQHQVSAFDRNLILWGAAGIAAYGAALVVPGLDGVYLVDGVSRPAKVSQAYESEYRRHVDNGRVPGKAIVYRNHYILPILAADGTPLDTLACRLDRPISSRGQTLWPWSNLEGTGAQLACLAIRAPVAAGEVPDLLGGSANDETSALSETFDVDVFGAGLMDFDLGVGTLSVVAGELVPSTTGAKRIYHVREDYTRLDVTVKVTTGAAAPAAYLVGPTKRIDANNELRAVIDGNLKIQKIDGGVLTTLATGAATALALSTSYWIGLRVEGALVTAEFWTSAPTPGAVPAASVTHTLIGGDDAQFGTAVGKVGIAFTPDEPDWRVDDLIVEFADARILDLSAYFEPTIAVKNDHDETTPYFEVVTRDYDPGDLAVHRWRKVRLLYELIADEDDDPQVFMDIGTDSLEIEEVLWGSEIWGAFDWNDSDEALFEQLTEPQVSYGAEIGQNAATWMSVARGRYARYRIRSSDPVAKLTVRVLEPYYAPAGIRPSRVS